MKMSTVLFLLMAALEIALAVFTCRKETEKKTWRKNRLFVRLAQLVIAVVAVLLPFGQKWRLTPVLTTLAILALIVGLAVLLKRRKAEGTMRKGKAISSCVLSIVLIGFSLFPAYIFTGYKGLPVSGGYAVKETSAILIDSARTDPFETDGSFREVPVHFYYPQTEAGSAETFPLVVFSHGAFGYYQSNTSTYMELASNGYVVAALDHPHHAFFTKDTAGGTVIVDMDFMNAALNLNNDTPVEEQYALYTEWMELRTADMNFAVDAVKAAVQTGTTDGSWFFDEKDGETIRTVLAMTDASKIGLMGHSMGGAAAVELGRERGDVAAVADLDGTMLGEYLGVENGDFVINDAPYPVPVLEFNNWSTYQERAEYLAQGGSYPNDVLMANAAAGFTTTIRGTEHMDFTDLPLLSPFLGNMLGSGERGAEETLTVVNSLVLQFFDCYLKGEGVFAVQDVY